MPEKGAQAPREAEGGVCGAAAITGEEPGMMSIVEEQTFLSPKPGQRASGWSLSSDPETIPAR